MGLYAGDRLGMELPQCGKRLFTIIESDGCFSDGVAVATNCWVGRRAMQVKDFGKAAATFVDTQLGRSIRIIPSHDERSATSTYAPGGINSWEAYLIGNQNMPTEMPFYVHEVLLHQSIEELISRPGAKAVCDVCSEEVINEREIRYDDRVLCRSCGGNAYYVRHPEVEITADRMAENVVFPQA